MYRPILYTLFIFALTSAGAEPRQFNNFLSQTDEFKEHTEHWLELQNHKDILRADPEHILISQIQLLQGRILSDEFSLLIYDKLRNSLNELYDRLVTIRLHDDFDNHWTAQFSSILGPNGADFLKDLSPLISKFRFDYKDQYLDISLTLVKALVEQQGPALR